jgi:hypothetical protein
MYKTKNTLTVEHRFDSPADLVREFKELGFRIADHGSWSGGLSETQTFRTLETGDETHVAEAEGLIRDIMEGIRIETMRTEWVNDMAGARPDVAAFLAGDPRSMKRKVIFTTEVAPLRLYVSLTSSSGVSTTVLKHRGICLLALVMALTRIRPVELYTFNAVTKYKAHQTLIDVVRMPTSPIDIGLICFCFVSQAFTRGLCYSYLSGHESSVLYNPPNKDIDDMRAMLSASPTDVIFPPIHLYDDYHDPKKWVKDQLTTILKLNEEQIESLT